MLEKTGYPVETFHILQMDFVKNIFWQRFDLLMILTGMYAAYRLCRKMTEKMKAAGIVEEEYSGGVSGRQEREEKRFGNGFGGKGTGTGVLYMAGVCAVIMLLWKLAAASWCVPPVYELPGKSWRDVLYRVLDLYLLIHVRIDNMHFLNYWNIVSLFFMTVYLYLFSRYYVRSSEI